MCNEASSTIIPTIVKETQCSASWSGNSTDCISDIHLLTNTTTKDIAGQSAKCSAGGRQAGAGVGDLFLIAISFLPHSSTCSSIIITLHHYITCVMHPKHFHRLWRQVQVQETSLIAVSFLPHPSTSALAAASSKSCLCPMHPFVWQLVLTGGAGR